MRAIIRAALASLLSVVFLVGPVSAATSQATTVAQASQTGTISGQVLGDNGSGLSGASVLLEGGGQHQTASSDASGNFTLTVPAGVYTVTVNKGGYQTGSTQVTVAPGTAVSLNVALTAASLNNLNVIGRTTSGFTGNAAKFNISSTAQQSLSQTQILERNAPDLTEVLNEFAGRHDPPRHVEPERRLRHPRPAV